MDELLRYNIGDIVKLYKWENESDFDINKQRIYAGRVISSKFVMSHPHFGGRSKINELETFEPEVRLDIKFMHETITNVLASTVRPAQDPYFHVGDHVCIVHPIGSDKFSKFGTIVKREIDTTLRNSLPMYDIRTIDKSLFRGVVETDLLHVRSTLWMSTWREWNKKCNDTHVFKPGIDTWIKPKLDSYFLKDSTNKKENAMPFDTDVFNYVSSAFTCTGPTLGSSASSSLTITPKNCLGTSATVYTVEEVPSVNAANTEKKEEKKMEKKSETPRPYVPIGYRVKRIIYNDPATIVFWNDGTKTVVKRGANEKFNKYTAFCAALAKKIYGNNSQVNKIVNSGLDETEKRAQKSAAKKIENKKPVKREIHVNSIHSDENWFHLIRKVTTRFTKQDIREKDVRFIVEQIKNYYESNKTIRDIAQELGVSESSVKATLKDMRDILGR